MRVDSDVSFFFFSCIPSHTSIWSLSPLFPYINPLPCVGYLHYLSNSFFHQVPQPLLPFTNMSSQQLQKQVANMRDSLFKQGYLDDQFVELENLSDDATPNFVEEVVTLFFRDSVRMVKNIEQTLENRTLDFDKLDKQIHQFKGSSSSIGAAKVKYECTLFNEYCKAENVEGCKRCFQQLNREYTALRKKLETYFQLSRQAGPSETACRPR